MIITIKMDLKDFIALTMMPIPSPVTPENAAVASLDYPNDEQKIFRRALIDKFLAGGLRTPPVNPGTPTRALYVGNSIQGNWIKDTKHKWVASQGYDDRIDMCKLEDLDDLIRSEVFWVEQFIEEVWLDTVMNGDMPWLILDTNGLKFLRDEMNEVEAGAAEESNENEENLQDKVARIERALEHQDALLRQFDEDIDRMQDVLQIQQISVPVSDDETSRELFG